MDSAVRSSLGYAIAHPGKEPNDLEEGLAETKKQLKDWRAEYEAMVQHPYKKNGKPLKPSTIKSREREVRRLERQVADYHAAMKLYEEDHDSGGGVAGDTKSEAGKGSISEGPINHPPDSGAEREDWPWNTTTSTP